ncbi:hypothetical protein [Caldimonas brevitalea]|uniref:Uncharacterized protein n=1 Tax=Caldimonas brevitalea TaxID=413882 RepID=A0A0G3BL91_9BURK|nr:hypothetical protein [Caldimonas brevitalea]AKJ27260.1 hypothetical protein AAW51_0569 [Caldimonas brevitalea]
MHTPLTHPRLLGGSPLFQHNFEGWIDLVEVYCLETDLTEAPQ